MNDVDENLYKRLKACLKEVPEITVFDEIETNSINRLPKKANQQRDIPYEYEIDASSTADGRTKFLAAIKTVSENSKKVNDNKYLILAVLSMKVSDKMVIYINAILEKEIIDDGDVILITHEILKLKDDDVKLILIRNLLLDEKDEYIYKKLFLNFEKLTIIQKQVLYGIVLNHVGEIDTNSLEKSIIRNIANVTYDIHRIWLIADLVNSWIKINKKD